jgi:S1-C subfamily serine protease
MTRRWNVTVVRNMMIMPSRLGLLLLTSVWIVACVSLEQPGIPLDAPVLLHPAAAQLEGGRTRDLWVEAKTTVTKVPLDTQLIRRTAERVRVGVVSIYTKTRIPVRLSLLPIRLPFTSVRVRLPGHGLGSGFFVHSKGYIVSNNHVVAGATDIRAITHDGKDYELIVVARDPSYDLALLKVRGVDKGFTALPMGDADAVDVGDLTIAVGNPLGLGHTVTFGIVSQTGRSLSGVSSEDGRNLEFFQTDTAINPGSSGGPLVTLTGAWVGVNTAGITQAQNIGFAVPSKLAREFLGEVLAGQGEKVSRAPGADTAG